MMVTLELRNAHIPPMFLCGGNICCVGFVTREMPTGRKPGLLGHHGARNYTWATTDPEEAKKLEYQSLANWKRSIACSCVRCGFSRGRRAATGMSSRRNAFFTVDRWPKGARAPRRISSQRTSRSLLDFLMSSLRLASIRNTMGLVYAAFLQRVSTRPRL